jgi:hypothetical protein
VKRTIHGGARCTARRPRAAARSAALARKGRRAGQPIELRQISFTAARRAAITTTQTGAATDP